jgi:hypothetical protein
MRTLDWKGTFLAMMITIIALLLLFSFMGCNNEPTEPEEWILTESFSVKNEQTVTIGKLWNEYYTVKYRGFNGTYYQLEYSSGGLSNNILSVSNLKSFLGDHFLYFNGHQLIKVKVQYATEREVTIQILELL